MAVSQIRTITPGTSSKDVGDQNVLGPLADLNKSDYSYNLFKYPMSAASYLAPENSHEIIFYINVPQASSWNTGQDAGGPPPVANRTLNASSFGLRTDSNGLDTGSDTTLQSPTAVVLSRKSVRTTSAISLYIPQTMVFTQNMHYDNVSLTDALGVVGDAASGISSALSGDLRGAGASALSIAPRLANAFGLNGVGDALAGVRNAGLSALGLADNPQNFLLFKQMDFRKFQFDFLLTPENSNEADIIEEIIYLFRFNSAPEVKAGTLGRFFVPPSDFDIDIISNGKRNQHLPNISTCVLNSVSVDYCASGQWGSYYTGAPLQTRLTLDFTETSIMTKDLIQGGF